MKLIVSCLLLLLVVTEILCGIEVGVNNAEKDYVTSAFSRDSVIFSVGKMNWFAANSFCTQLGIKLLTLESSVDNEDFNKFVNHYNLHEQYWLSANRLEDNTTFRWGFRGPPFSFQNWNLHQPDNKDGIQYCLKVLNNKWDDENCFEALHVICHY